MKSAGFIITSRTILFTLAFFAAFFPWCKAQDSVVSGKVMLLKDLVIASSRAGSLYPVTHHDIYGLELKAKNIGQEPSFLLSATPSVTNYSDAGSFQGYSYFRIRGIDQTRINMSLDGVPLNEPEDQGAYFSNYPDLLNSVSSIQIQRGAGVCKNGVAAFGGSLQLFSVDVWDSTRVRTGVGYGSFGTGRAFVECRASKPGKAGIYFRTSVLGSGGYKYRSRNASQSAFVKAVLVKPRSVWQFIMMGGHQQNQLAWLGVVDSLIRADARTNANGEEDDAFVQSLAQVKWVKSLGRNALMNAAAYYTFLDGGYEFDLNNFLGLPSTNEMFRYDFRSHLAGAYVNASVEKGPLELSGGLHGNAYQREHAGSERTFGQLYENTGFKQEFTAHGRAFWAVKKFFFQAEAQVRTVGFQYQGNVQMQSLNWTFFNPRFGISWAPNRQILFYYGAGRTGREPTRNDLFGGNDDLLSDSLGNALLFITQPEFVIDQELGLRSRNSRIKWEANFFFMTFNHEIVLNGKFGPNGLALTNDVDRSIRTGLEFSFTIPVGKRLSFIQHSSFTLARIREAGTTFSPVLTPPIIMNQEVMYRLKRFTMSITGRYQSSAYIDFANSAQVKGYYLMNARVAYDLKRFQLALFLNNCTNARYFNQGYVDYDGTSKYFVQAPFHFMTSAAFSF